MEIVHFTFKTQTNEGTYSIQITTPCPCFLLQEICSVSVHNTVSEKESIQHSVTPPPLLPANLFPVAAARKRSSHKPHQRKLKRRRWSMGRTSKATGLRALCAEPPGNLSRRSSRRSRQWHWCPQPPRVPHDAPLSTPAAERKLRRPHPTHTSHLIQALCQHTITSLRTTWTRCRKTRVFRLMRTEWEERARDNSGRESA